MNITWPTAVVLLGVVGALTVLGWRDSATTATIVAAVIGLGGTVGGFVVPSPFSRQPPRQQ